MLRLAVHKKGLPIFNICAERDDVTSCVPSSEYMGNFVRSRTTHFQVSAIQIEPQVWFGRAQNKFSVSHR